MNTKSIKTIIILTIGATLFLSGGIGLSACGSPQELISNPEEDRLHVVGTTTFIGDVIKNIAGDAVDLVVLLDSGQNPHSYLLSPQDMVQITEADVIFVNGFGLEEFLDDLIVGGNASEKIVVVSEGISGLVGDDDHDHGHEDELDDGHKDELDDDHVEGIDPHVWFDPENISVWVENITSTLIDLDPERSDLYQSNADSYLSELADLQVWIQSEIDQIPLEDRKLVSDHLTLSYFAEAYQFELVGEVTPSTTTEAETSGSHLAELIDSIPDQQIKAVFIGFDFDTTLAQQVADETGIEMIQLYFGSLSQGPPADTYLDFMRYNVTAITNALKE